MGQAWAITPVSLGMLGEAKAIQVSALTFSASATSCTLYYQLFNADMKQVTEGNLSLSGQAFEDWAEDNYYLITFACGELGLTATGAVYPEPIEVVEPEVAVEEAVEETPEEGTSEEPVDGE
jgi:hypothetical protein